MKLHIFCLTIFIWMLSFFSLPLSATAPAGRYTDQTGGALTGGSTQVKDTQTGLIWERAGSPTLRTWSSSSAPGSAQEYCAIATTGGLAAGSWRLPGVKELYTLNDAAVASGVMIDLVAFPATVSGGFCSSTVAAHNAGMSWRVSFGSSATTPAFVNSFSCNVRCVR